MQGVTMTEQQALQPALVREFVANAHGDLDRVKELLAEEPALIHAALDWGDGDWETALGAAAHVGRRDIALYLLDRGARIDIFAAAMLGYLDVVTAIVRVQPEAWRQRGPHGIPLIRHASVGGDGAATVLAYLRRLEAESQATMAS
jgi:hypothetical protein